MEGGREGGREVKDGRARGKSDRRWIMNVVKSSKLYSYDNCQQTMVQ